MNYDFFFFNSVLTLTLTPTPKENTRYFRCMYPFTHTKVNVTLVSPIHPRVSVKIQPSPAQQGHDYHPTEERRVLMPTPNSGKCHCLWCWQLDIMSNTSPCGFHHVVKKKRRKKSVVWRLLRVRNLLVFVFMLPKRDIPGPTYTVFSSIRLTSLYLTFFLSDSKGIFMG